MRTTREKLHFWGGLAALFEALIYVAGFAAMAVWLNPGNTEGMDAALRLAFVLERQALFQAVNLLIYVGFGLVLVLLTTALHERLRAGNEELMGVATPFGYIWAGLVIASGMLASVGLSAIATLQVKDPSLALSAWQVLAIVQAGLGGGVEVVGGIWVLLLSFVGLRVSARSPLAWLGLVVGISGVLTVVPGLRDLGTVFGLTQILWFAGTGIALLRSGTAAPVKQSAWPPPVGKAGA